MITIVYLSFSNLPSYYAIFALEEFVVSDNSKQYLCVGDGCILNISYSNSNSVYTLRINNIRNTFLSCTIRFVHYSAYYQQSDNMRATLKAKWMPVYH